MKFAQLLLMITLSGDSFTRTICSDIIPSPSTRYFRETSAPPRRSGQIVQGSFVSSSSRPRPLSFHGRSLGKCWFYRRKEIRIEFSTSTLYFGFLELQTQDTDTQLNWIKSKWSLTLLRRFVFKSISPLTLSTTTIWILIHSTSQDQH